MRELVTKVLFLYGFFAVAFVGATATEEDASTNATVLDTKELLKVPFEEEAMERERKNGPFARSSSPQECDAVAPERREVCDVTPHQEYADIILNNSTFCRYMDCCFDYTSTFPIETGYPRCYRKALPNPQVAALLQRARQCSAVPVVSRESCGWYREITEGECIYRDCCWDPAAYGTTLQCYKLPNQDTMPTPVKDDAYPKPAYGISEGNALEQERQVSYITAQCQDIDLYSPCGTADVLLQECQSLGCCWVESDSYNVKCFKSSPIASGNRVSTGSVPIAETVEIAPVPTKVYDRLPNPQHKRPVESQTREVKPKSGIQNKTPDLSALTQMMIFCGKKDKTLCTMSMMSILGGGNMKPSTEAPSAQEYMNYVLRRKSFGESSSEIPMQPKIPGEMYIQYSPIGDAYLDEQCYNTTQLKMYARFHAPCGGFLKSKKITNEQECINEKCCWFDDYHSILRKALKLDNQKPSMLNHVYPMLGINIAGGANCIEALSYRQISKIGQMSALNSYREDAEHSSLNSPQMLNLFLDQDDPVSTLMSSMMLLSGGSLSQMSRPMLYSMAQSEDDSRVILPMVFNKIQEDSTTTSSASPAVSSRSSLMGIMPALLMLGSKNNDDEGDTKNDFLPLIMAAMSSNGNVGANAGGIDPLYLAMLSSDGGLSDPLLQMAILSMRNRPLVPYGNGSQAHNQQAWGSEEPNYQSVGQSSAEQPQQNQMSGFITALMMSKFMEDDSDSGSSLKDLLPILLSQSQASGGQMSPDLAYMIPALLSGDSDNSNNAMMMQMLASSDMSRNPQLMTLLLSNSEGESDESSMMPMLMYALSQQDQASQGGKTDMMSWMLPMLLNRKSSENSTDSFEQLLPIIMSMQTSNSDSQSLAMPLLLNNPSMLSDNPSLLASLFSNPTAPEQSPSSSGLPVSAMMSLMSGKPLDPFALLSMTASNTQRPNAFGQGPGLYPSANNGNRNIFGNSPQTNIPREIRTNNLVMNPAVQSVLGSEGNSMDKLLIKLLMKSQQGGSDSTNSIFGQTQQSQFMNQPQNPFANPQFNPPTNPFQPSSYNSLSGQSQQSPFPNMPVNMPGFFPNTNRPLINPNAFPNFGQVSNDVTTGILVAPHDNEHSYNKDEPDCMIPPGAEEECELNDVQSPLITEHLCKERKCCWNPVSTIACYKSASQS